MCVLYCIEERIRYLGFSGAVFGIMMWICGSFILFAGVVRSDFWVILKVSELHANG